MILAKLDAWEAAFFGCPVIRLSLSAGAPLGEWLKMRPAIREYIVARVPTEDIALIHVLEQHGFRMLVPMIMLEGAGVPSTSMSAGDLVSGIELDSARSEDVPVLAEIARRAFMDGRFRAEPGLSDDVVDEMYATWTRNCCNKSLADEVFVARVAGRAVGFVAVRCDNLQTGEIGLIAVSPDMQGHGIGSALLETGCHWASTRVENMIAWTPLSNIAAIRMYEKCDFRVGGSALYYRLWRE